MDELQDVAENRTIQKFAYLTCYHIMPQFNDPINDPIEEA